MEVFAAVEANKYINHRPLNDAQATQIATSYVDNSKFVTNFMDLHLYPTSCTILPAARMASYYVYIKIVDNQQNEQSFMEGELLMNLSVLDCALCHGVMVSLMLQTNYGEDGTQQDASGQQSSDQYKYKLSSIKQMLSFEINCCIR